MSTVDYPPRPWWMVAIAFVVLVVAFAGLMFTFRWCGGGERRHIRRIPLPPLLEIAAARRAYLPE